MDCAVGQVFTLLQEGEEMGMGSSFQGPLGFHFRSKILGGSPLGRANGTSSLLRANISPLPLRTKKLL